MKQKTLIVTSKGTHVVEVDYEPTPPTREEIIAKKQAQIDSYKAELSASDYKAIKFSEGLISAEDYEPIKAHRQALRDEINRLEEELKV